MKHAEKFVLVPYTEFKHLTEIQKQQNDVDINPLSDTGHADSPNILSSQQVQQMPEDFNVNDFITYLKGCERASCSDSVKPTPTINTDNVEPKTKKIKREWLML